MHCFTLAAPPTPIAGISPLAGAAAFLNGNCLLRSGILQAGAQRLYMLIRLADAVSAPLFHKDVACAEKRERNTILPTLVVKQLDPIIVERTGAVVVFSVCKHGFQLANREIGFQIHFPDKRRNHHALMLCRDIQKDRKPFLRPRLILRRYIDGDIVPAIQPVPGQARMRWARFVSSQK